MLDLALYRPVSNHPAIARAFNVAAFSPSGDPVIDVTALFTTEVPELSVPTVGDDEGWRGLLEAELADPEVLAARGGAFEHLDQLALEHLYGVR